MHVLNIKNKKNAINRMNSAKNTFEDEKKSLIFFSSKLFENRQNLKKNLDNLWNIVNEFRNKPTELDTNLTRIKIEYNRYDELIKKIGVEDKKSDTGSILYTNVASSVGGALVGTTSSTIGAAGLSLLGPVGIGIVATGIVTGGLLQNGKNKKVIKQANEATENITAQIDMVKGSINEINILNKQTIRSNKHVDEFSDIISDYLRDYNLLTTDQQYKLGTIVNDSLSYAKLLNKTIGKK